MTPAESLNLEHHKRLLVIKALNRLPTKSRAAMALGICERSLYKLIKRYGVKMGKDGRYGSKHMDYSAIEKTSCMSKIDKIISNKLKALREKSNYSQQDIAEILDIPLVKIKLMENGIDTIPATRIYFLCFILGCSPNDLFPPIKKTNGRKQDIKRALTALLKAFCR